MKMYLARISVNKTESKYSQLPRPQASHILPMRMLVDTGLEHSMSNLVFELSWLLDTFIFKKLYCHSNLLIGHSESKNVIKLRLSWNDVRPATVDSLLYSSLNLAFISIDYIASLPLEGRILCGNLQKRSHEYEKNGGKLKTVRY